MSFIAPCLRRFSSQEEHQQGDGDVLTPIDEDEEEDEPITMGQGAGVGKNIPKIIETVSSPNEIEQKESVL